jgi:hypothetical protein
LVKRSMQVHPTSVRLPGRRLAGWALTWLLVMAPGVVSLELPAQADQPVIITLSTDADAVPADGHSVANISVQAWSGQSHYSGPLQVNLQTTLGDLEPGTVTLNDGLGWTRLRSGAATGLASVNVQVAGGPRQVILPSPLAITFVAPGTRLISAESQRSLKAKADYLAYSVDFARLIAVQHVHLEYRGLEITADSASMDLTSMELRAQSLSTELVSVTHLGQTVKVRRLYVNFNSGSGMALAPSAAGGIETETFSLAHFELTPLKGPAIDTAFDTQDISGSALTVRARQMLVYPGAEIRCSGASIIVSGKPVLSLPFYRLSLNPENPAVDQYVSYDSYAGLGINIPFYYMLNDHGMGSLRLEHQERTGFFGTDAQGGWSLNLLQAYGSAAAGSGYGGGTGGTLGLDRITSPDWGLTWRHNQRFGAAGLINGYIYSPDHKGVTANLGLSMPYHGLGLSLTTFGNHQSGVDSLSSQFVVDLPQRSLLHQRVRYNVAASVGTNFLQTKLGTLNSSSFNWVPGLAANFYLSPWTLDKKTSVTPSVSARYFLPPSGGYQSTNTGITLAHQIGSTGSMGLTYNWSSQGATNGIPAFSNQLLSAYLYDQIGYRLRLTANPSYDLTGHSLYATGAMNLTITPVWSLDMEGQLASGGAYGLNDWQIGVARALFGRYLRLFYQASTHKIRLEVTSGQFGW